MSPPAVQTARTLVTTLPRDQTWLSADRVYQAPTAGIFGMTSCGVWRIQQQSAKIYFLLDVSLWKNSQGLVSCEFVNRVCQWLFLGRLEFVSYFGTVIQRSVVCGELFTNCSCLQNGWDYWLLWCWILLPLWLWQPHAIWSCSRSGYNMPERVMRGSMSCRLLLSPRSRRTYSLWGAHYQ